MRRREIVGLLLLTGCLLGCPGSGDEAPAPQDDAESAAGEAAPVFEDGFESGDTADWDEPSEDDQEDDQEGGGDGS